MEEDNGVIRGGSRDVTLHLQQHGHTNCSEAALVGGVRSLLVEAWLGYRVADLRLCKECQPRDGFRQTEYGSAGRFSSADT
jgi:hypothetical protein